MVEEGKKKSEYYLPEGKQPLEYPEFGLKVYLIDAMTDSALGFRRTRLKLVVKEKEHRVTHLHFLAWPDRGSRCGVGADSLNCPAAGVPTSTKQALAFVERIHIAREDAPGPCLYHCSAGLGRTGVIIALEVGTDIIRNNKEVNAPWLALI